MLKLWLSQATLDHMASKWHMLDARMRVSSKGHLKQPWRFKEGIPEKHIWAKAWEVSGVGQARKGAQERGGRGWDGRQEQVPGCGRGRRSDLTCLKPGSVPAYPCIPSIALLLSVTSVFTCLHDRRPSPRGQKTCLPHSSPSPVCPAGSARPVPGWLPYG